MPAKLSKEVQAKLDAANERRRQRRESQRAEAAEALKLEHFVEVAASGAMVVEAGTAKGKQGAKARDAVWNTFMKLGGEDAMLAFAQKYPKEFFTQIFARLIPKTAELEASDNLEELLAQMGGGRVPGMLEHMPEAEFEEVKVDDMEVTKETLQ